MRIRSVGAEQHLQVAGTIDDGDRHVEAVRLARGQRAVGNQLRGQQRNVSLGQYLPMRRKRRGRNQDRNKPR